MKLALAAALMLSATALAAQDSTARPAAPAPAANIRVEAVLTNAVVDRMPSDTVTALAAPQGQDTVYLWTRISGAEPGTVLHYVWFHGEEQVGDVSLTINGSPWRTWSSKIIPAEATGAWRAEIRDANGAVLQKVEFTVGG